MGLARRKSVRVVAVVLAVLLLAVVAVKIFLPAEKIRDLALDQARARLGREVSVGQVAVSLKGGLGVRLDDFAVHNPDGFGGEHLLATKALDLKLAIRPLFKGEIRVDRLVLDAPQVNLVVQADGGNNYTFTPVKTAADSGSAAAPDPAKPAPPPLSVNSLTIRDGQITFSDESAAAPALQTLQVAGLVLDASLTDPAPSLYQVQGKMTAEKITMTGPSTVPELNGAVDFDVTWDMSASRLDITRAEVQVNDLPLSCSGQVVVAAEASTGQVQFQMSDQALVNLAAFAPAELAEKITGNRDSGRMDATVVLDLTGNATKPFHTSGKVAIREADLSLAQPFLPANQAGRLAGRGDLELSFDQQSGDPAQMTYSGTATARGVSYTESGLVDELHNLDATLQFTPEEVTIESCRAAFASGTFDLKGKLSDPLPYFLPPEMQGTGEIKKPHLIFALRSARLDVDRLLPAASPTGSQGKTGPGAKTIAKDMEFPDFTSDGTFRADSLIYMKVPFTDVIGEVKLRDRILKINQVKGAVYNGRVDGQVDIDLKKLSDPVYAGSYQARDIEADNFVTRFAGMAGVVFGGCDMSGSFSAHGLDPEAIRNSLTLDSDADLKKGRVVTSGNVQQTLSKLAAQAGQTIKGEQTLRDLATHIRVQNGRVGLDALTASLGQIGELTVDGYYAFNGDLNYTGQILLSKAQTDLLFSAGVLGELGKLLGSKRPERLALPLTLGGTRTDPKMKLDLGTVTSELQERAAQEQGKKLEDKAKSKLDDLLKKWK